MEYTALIGNTSDWNNHWFKGMDGRMIVVKTYPYKATKNGDLDYCNCKDCVERRKGLELFQSFEIVKPVEYAGSIIPRCCLCFRKF